VTVATVLFLINHFCVILLYDMEGLVFFIGVCVCVCVMEWKHLRS